MTEISVREIQERVASRFHTNRAELIARGRRKNVSEARQLAIYLTRKLTGYKYEAIAFSFGERDHTTIIHAFDVVSQKLADGDPDTEFHVKQLTEYFRRAPR